MQVILKKYFWFVVVVLSILMICLFSMSFAFASNDTYNSAMENFKTEKSSNEQLNKQIDNQNIDSINSNPVVHISSFEQLKSCIENFGRGKLNCVLDNDIEQNETIIIKDNQDIKISSPDESHNYKIIKTADFEGEMFKVTTSWKYYPSKLTILNIAIDGGAKWTNINKDNNNGIQSLQSGISVSSFCELNLENSIVCNFDCIENASAVYVEKESLANISNSYLIDNKSRNTGSAVNALGEVSFHDDIVMKNFTTNFSGAIYIGETGKIYLKGKINIEENVCSTNKSDIFTDTDWNGIVIKSEILEGSKIGLNFTRDVAQDDYYAVRAADYNADFGSVRDCFFFDQTTELMPYCKNNKLSAEYLGRYNGRLVGSGKEDDPLQITKAEDFLEIDKQPAIEYVVMNNINFSKFENWIPLCRNQAFTGHLRASSGTTISNLNIVSDKSVIGDLDGIGLFYQASEFSRIQNLTLDSSCNFIVNDNDIKFVGSFCAKIVGSNSWKNSDGAVFNPNLLSCSSSARINFSDESLDMQIVVGGLVGVSDGGLDNCTSRCSFVGQVDDIFNNYQNVGALVGAQDWKNNESTKNVAESITSHSGGMSGKAQNSLEDIIGMMNANPDFIEVDVGVSSDGVIRCDHSETPGKGCPTLKGVLLLLIGDEGPESEYRDKIPQTSKRYRDREKIQLDIKGRETLRHVVPLLIELYEKYNYPLNKVLVAGDTTYGTLCKRSTLSTDVSNGLILLLDDLNDLADKGLIMGMNSNHLYDNDHLNNKDETIIKRFTDEMGFDSEKNSLLINTEHTEIDGSKECWIWLKQHNINLSVWVVDSPDNVNLTRGVYNVTTKKRSVLDKRNSFRELIAESSAPGSSLPLCGTYDLHLD